MVDAHKIKKRIEIDEFISNIKVFNNEEIFLTNHALFRLNESQRKKFDIEFFKNLLFNEIPILVGIQNNNLYSIFYKYQKDILRIILDIQINNIYIVTFYIIDRNQIPKI